MDTLTHYMLAILAGLAMGLRMRHKMPYLALVSLSAVLIDLDHFLVPLGYESDYRSMHNIFVAILLPIGLFLISYRLEKGSGSDRYQTFFLLVTVMLTSHLIADAVYGPVRLLSPLSEQEYALPKINVQATDQFVSQVVGPMGIGLTLYVGVILAGATVYHTLYYRNREGLKAKDALNAAAKDLF